jgi:hypothetical protein
MGKIVQIFEGRSCVDVWLQAMGYLVEHTPALNLVLGIETPDRLSGVEYQTQQRVDEFLEQHDAPRISTVANTIFPGSEFLHGGSHEVYDGFPKIFPVIREGWGTYAMRLLTKSLPTKDGKSLQSPLKQLISKMKRQRETSQMRSVYESVLVENEDVLTDLPIYRAESDSRHIRGKYLPCLSYLSFKLLPDTVALTAMYRYHYYVQRALGNLIGLAQLQAFVAEQVGVGVGPLICHSTYAKLDTDSGWTVKEVENLVQQCSELMSMSAA